MKLDKWDLLSASNNSLLSKKNVRLLCVEQMHYRLFSFSFGLSEKTPRAIFAEFVPPEDRG
jgi:hypothetical protein